MSEQDLTLTEECEDRQLLSDGVAVIDDLEQLEAAVGCSCTASDDNPYNN